MTSSSIIRLHIPRQDLSYFEAFQPNREGATAWAQALPVTNTTEVAEQLAQALGDLNRLKLAPELRFSILEILQPNIQVAQVNLAKRFLKQPLVMPEEPSRMAALSDKLATLATTAYTIVAVETVRHRDAIRDTNPARLACSALQRALVYAGSRVLRTYQLYKPLDILAWQNLHQLYALAEGQQLENLPVPDPQEGGSTITRTYLQAILLACCNPNQLRQSDLTALYRGLKSWGGLSKLYAANTSNCIFAVDLDSDQPPRHSSLFENDGDAKCRFIETQAIAEHLAILGEESKGAGISVESEYHLSESILDHLVSSLSGRGQRNFERETARNAYLSVCVGLNSTHYHVSGGRVFGHVIYGDDFANKRIDTAQDNPFFNEHSTDDGPQSQSNTRDYMVEELYEAPDYPIFEVKLADVSPGGYCLEWGEEFHGELKTGDLISLREDENSHWVVAVVRWLSRIENAKSLVGLELLSPMAIPYGARLHTRGAEAPPVMRALLLPAIPLVGQPHTLVIPRATLRERQKITLFNADEEFTIALQRQIASTGGCSLFEFKRTKELGDVLAEENRHSHSTEYDSIWSHI